MPRDAKPMWAMKIKALRGERGESQQKFAERLGVQQPTVWAWEKGDKKRAPSAEAFFRLGSLATQPDDKIYFWGLGGLDKQSILEAAESISKFRRRPKPGEIILLPSYRASGLGLKRAGKDVPLPAEFVPNPGSTICLRAEAGFNGLVSGPRGLYIVDRSKGRSDRLRDLLHRVVVLSFAARDELLDDPSGIYVGRIWMQHGGWKDRSGVKLLHRWSLVLLSSDLSAHHVALSSEATRLPFDILADDSRTQAFGIVDLLNWLKDRPEKRSIFEKARADLLDSARVPPGSKILGEVIGRLTGHIKKAKD